MLNDLCYVCMLHIPSEISPFILPRLVVFHKIPPETHIITKIDGNRVIPPQSESAVKILLCLSRLCLFDLLLFWRTWMNMNVFNSRVETVGIFMYSGLTYDELLYRAGSSSIELYALYCTSNIHIFGSRLVDASVGACFIHPHFIVFEDNEFS